MLTMTLTCLAPEHDWAWLRRHPHVPTKREARAARRPVRLVEPGVMLAGLIARLEAIRHAPVTMDNALRVRDLMLVTVCTCTALRLKNLLGLTLGRSIFRHGGGFEIRYGAGALKNRRQITIRLMAEVTPHLDLYIGTYRPIIIGSRDDSGGIPLWVSRKGKPLDNQAAEKIFKAITAQVQGWAANPQSFRHSAVTALVSHDARSIEAAAALLGHGDTTTTSTYYDLSESEAARSKWRMLVERYRPSNGRHHGPPRGNAWRRERGVRGGGKQVENRE
jgi:site-specific recombinase XerD